MAGSIALVNVPAASADTSSPNGYTLEASALDGTSFGDAQNMFDDDTDLTADTDYHNGSNTSVQKLKTENHTDQGPENLGQIRALAGIANGAWVRYQDVDLGSSSATSVTVNYDAPTNKAIDTKIAIHLDSMSNPAVDTIDVPLTGSNWDVAWGSYTATLSSAITGDHTVYLEFLAGASQSYFGNFGSLTFNYAVPASTIRGDAAAVPFSVTTDRPNSGNEGVMSLIDQNASTKWYTTPPGGGHATPSTSNPVYAIYTLGQKTTVTDYTMTAGADSGKYPTRDPKDWEILGSNDDSVVADAAGDPEDASWEVLDSQSGQTFGVNGLSRDYQVTTPGSYKYYMLRVTAAQVSDDSTNMQLADWTLHVGVPGYSSALVTGSTQWSYLDDPTGEVDPDQGSAPWTEVGASSPGTWKRAAGPFGAKNGAADLGANFPVTTTLPLHKDNDTSKDTVPAFFFRHTITLDQDAVDSIKSMYGSFLHDDAVVVYLNGKVVYSHLGATPPTGNLTYGGDAAGDPRVENIRFNVDNLNVGDNVLAVEVHNVDSTSSDVYFSMPQLSASSDSVPVGFTPDEINATYPSDTVPSEPKTADNPTGDFFIHLLSGFNDLAANHPEILAANAVLPGDKPLTAVNDKVDVAINNGAQGHADKIAQATTDANGAPYQTMADGFGSVLGPIYSRALSTGQLPKTSELLGSMVERGRNHEPAKAAFDYLRPYNRLGTLTGDVCNGSSFSGVGRIALNYGPISSYNGLCTNGSFPSGHTNHGYSQGTILATLLPELAPQILYRTSEYGNNRLVLGFHYPLDVISGRMAGQTTAQQRWSDPDFRALLEQAQTELQSTLSADCVAAGYSADLKECADAGTGVVSDADAMQIYTERLNYSSYTLTDGTRKTDGFPTVYSNVKNTPETVPYGAADLLRTAFPDLTDPQRDLVLKATALPGGDALDKTVDSEASWERINLLAAMEADVAVDPTTGDVTVNGTNMGQPAATETTVEFESIDGSSVGDAHNSFASDSNLVEGEDYAEGSNGIDSSKDDVHTEDGNGGRVVGGVTTGAWIRYQNVDLGSNQADKLELTYDAPVDKAVDPKVEVYVDSMDGDPFVTADLPLTGTAGSSWGDYETTTIDLPQLLSGKHDLYFKFLSTPDNPHFYVGNFDSFSLVYATGPKVTQQQVEFESIEGSNGLLSANSALQSGVDFQDGSNGVDASKDGLKTESNGSASGGRQLAGVTTGAWVRYQNVDLGYNTALALQVRYDSPSGKANQPQLKLYVDSMSNDPVATIDLDNTGSGWGTYATATVDLPQGITGKHDLYWEFLNRAEPNDPQFYVGNFDSFTFLYTIDKSGLDDAISTYEPYTDHSDWYPTDTYQTFSDALAAAQQVSQDPNASYTDVQDALSALQDAANNLQWTVVSDLNDLVSQARQVGADNYTTDSYQALQNAIAAAQILNPSVSSHDDYETAYSDLSDALDGLTARQDTETTIVGAPATVDEGTDVSFEVQVTAGATGAVTVSEGSEPVAYAALDGDSTAQVTVTGLAVGTHSFIATYAGDGNFLPSDSEPVTVTVQTVTVTPPTPVSVSVPVVKHRKQVWNAKKKARAVLSSVVAGASAGTVTFRSGSTVLGSAKVGASHVVSVRLARKLAVGKYHRITATFVAADGRSVVSAASASTVKVKKAKIKKLKLKAPKKAKRHHKFTVKVKASKKLSNARKAKGKIKVKVGKKTVKKINVKKLRKHHGKIKVKIKKRFVHGKKLKVKATFVPKKKQRVGVKKTTVKKKVRLKK